MIKQRNFQKDKIMSEKRNSLKKIFYGKNTIHMMNFFFTIMLVGGAVMLVDTSYEEVKQIAQIANPLTSAIALILAVPVLSLLFAMGSNLDRHCAEDYSFQLMANAAIVAVGTMFFCNLFASIDFIKDAIGLRDIVREDMVGMTMMSWAIGFFYFQRKGLK
jgi:hypothetical protein